MASPEHSQIVIDAGGNKTIKEVQAAYEGTGHEELVNTCKSALLSMTKLEKRPARQKYLYNDRHALNDPSVDPLKDYRNTLLSGTVMSVFKGGKKAEKHFKVTKDWQSLQWKDPKKESKKAEDSMPLKDLRAVRLGHRDFTKAQIKKSDAKKCFSIVNTMGATVNIEANTVQDQQLWVSAVETLIDTVRNNPKWLK